MTLLDSIRRALIPYEAPVITAVEVPARKAALGAGAWVMENHQPLSYGRSDSPRFMKRAQQISHNSPWVAAAERVVSGKVGTIGWHLEDQEGEKLDDTGTGPVADFRRLIERPSPRQTRRELWQLTSRHLGICGNAFWFLDQRNAVTNAPLAIIYINPARMTPAADKAGNLTGWLLDAEDEYNWGKGVPIQLEEVLHFTFEPPDWGHFGIGILESALTKIEISRFADRYTAGVLAAGGKRGGIASAKEGILPDEVFQGVVNSFRNVAESPDATKRTIVTQGALDYQFTSATPQELSLAEITALNRDDILGIWGVPLSQLGIMSARGLNSGETVKYEEAALWQGAIHPRVVSMWEVIQYQLIDRIDPDWQLVLEEPTFDDQEPLFKLADLAKTQPLKNIERRELLGLEPFGDERDEDVWLPSGFERIYPEGAGVNPPSPVPLALARSTSTDQEEAEDDAEETQRAKATLGPLASFRAEVDAKATPKIERAMTKFLADQRDYVVARVKARARHFLQKPKDAAAILGKDWDAELAKVLLPLEAAIAEGTASEVRKVIPKARKADPFEQDAIDFARTRAGERITGINGTTRDAVLRAVQDEVEVAIREGLHPGEVGIRLTDRIGALSVWDAARSELVARTETMFAYNDAALKSYDNLGVTHVIAFDGDKDAECADRDGRTFTIDESYEIADHPNGTLDWGPVTKASLEPLELREVEEEATRITMPSIVLNPTFHIEPAPTPNVTVNVPEQPAPIVNVAAAAAPLVTVNVPEQAAPVIHVEQPAHKATLPDGILDVRIVDDVSPPTVKRVIRDTQGRIEGVIEGKQGGN